MLTKERALTATEFHYGECTRVVGPRGGVTERIERWRRSGKTRTWVTRPNEFEVPVKYGMYKSAYVRHSDRAWHAAEDCPLRGVAHAKGEIE